MPPVFVVVFGVSGSGKTTIGELLARQLGWRFYDADDFHPRANIEKMRSGVPLTDDDRWPWLDNLRGLVTRCAQQSEDAVLACSALKQSYRQHLRVHDNVQLVYLRGDRRLISERLRQRRGHFMDPALLASQFADLDEPQAHERAVIADAAKPPAAIVADIKATLGVSSA